VSHLPQEVEAVRDVRDDRLLRREREATFAHELLHERPNLRFQDLFRDAGDDKVVCKSYEIHLGAMTELWLREAFAQPPFETIQGEIR